MQTKFQCECVSKKEKKNWDLNRPKAYEIELSVPYDTNSIYYQMSGGTGFMLNTVNEEAAGMFEIGKKYDVLISPSEE